VVTIPICRYKEELVSERCEGGSSANTFDDNDLSALEYEKEKEAVLGSNLITRTEQHGSHPC
jgi:hypothetical protein